MNTLIIIEYVINFIILSLFNVHMFQLNSYSNTKHIIWIKSNIKIFIIQTLGITIPTVLILFNNFITNIISILFLGYLIFYNFPKSKAKISLKITNRVKRLFLTQLIIISAIVFITINRCSIFIVLCFFNILCPCMCIICNFINSPVELIRKKKYIKEAKKILHNMPNLIVIGITGSYGKTSVKNFLEKTLSAKYEVLSTPQNYNTTMGIVKTIRENLKPIHQVFICEMGATTIGDIKEICDIVNPKIGIITAIGPQHLESFKSVDNIIKAKLELLDAVKKNNGTLFLNYNNEYLSEQKTNMKILSYGINNTDLDYNSYNLNSSPNGLSFKIIDKVSGKEILFSTKLIGKHNIINLTAAIAVANHMGIPLYSLVSHIRSIKGVEHRLQLVSHNNFTLIDDSYNSNPISSKSALDTLAEFNGTKIIVTPGLIELGTEEKKYNFELGQYMTNICDYIYLVGGEHSKSVMEGILSKDFNKKKIFTVSHPIEALKHISKLVTNNKITVLLENDLPDNYNL